MFLSYFTASNANNAGKCPIFPVVSNRDKSCYEARECDLDTDCGNIKKCCENPCGVRQCFKPVVKNTTLRKYFIAVVSESLDKILR